MYTEIVKSILNNNTIDFDKIQKIDKNCGINDENYNLYQLWILNRNDIPPKNLYINMRRFRFNMYDDIYEMVDLLKITINKYKNPDFIKDFIENII